LQHEFERASWYNEYFVFFQLLQKKLRHEFEQAFWYNSFSRQFCFCSFQWDAVEYEFGGFNDLDSASGPGQWRGLEIGNCEEEAASSAGSEATC